MIDVILVEDHNIVRNGLNTLLNNEEGIRVVAEARNGNEVMDMIESGQKADVIITDINMPGLDGITVTKRITENYPHIRVIVLSMYDQAEYINKAYKSGAAAYLLKNVGPEELVYAIRYTSLKDERYICSELAMKMLDRQIQASDFMTPVNSDLDFTRKEIEILTLVSEGYTNQEIAERLFTSKRTVEGHRQSLIDKTGVRNSSALIRYALINGIIK